MLALNNPGSCPAWTTVQLRCHQRGVWGGSSTALRCQQWLQRQCRGRETPSHQPANGRTSSPSDPETGHATEQQGVPPHPCPLIHRSPERRLHRPPDPHPDAQLPCAPLHPAPPDQGGAVGKLPPVLFLQNKKLGANIHQTHNQKFARESKPQI